MILTGHRTARSPAAVPDRPAPPEPAETRQTPPEPGPGFVRRHHLLLIAICILALYHGSLLLSGSYQRTYDAYVHIFMADHYRRGWFTTWEPRWYTGFTTVSYPPGSHYAIAALSQFAGLRGAFVVVQICALMNLTVGVYRWSRIWVDDRAAGWAAILLVVSSSISETVHVFGQLPTTFSLGFLLNSLPYAYRWVRGGNRKHLLLGIVCTAATTAGHHVTTLFGAVFFVGPVLVAALVAQMHVPLPEEPGGHLSDIGRRSLWPVAARRLRRVLRPFVRTAVYGTLLVSALLIVVLPYWLYSHSDPITQVSIPHASRDNFLENTAAGLVFWVIPWGTTVLTFPYAMIRALTSTAWPLGLSLAVLAFFGTGGTTPFPRLILGGSFYILTLDRFTFWATISILPLAGALVSSVTDGSIRAWLIQNIGRRLAGLLPVLFAITHLAFTLFSANLTHYRPFQPKAIDPDPIVAFLDKDQHSRWRYLFLGFGDQMAWVGANTTAETVDGNYHSARRLPELTSRPVERLEGAKYSGLPGIGSLQQFLAVPERYNLKYVFNNDAFYAPLLNFSGWHELGSLENGIMVWERADISPLASDREAKEVATWQRLMWGTIPVTALCSASLLLIWAAFGARVPHWFKRLVRRKRRFPLPHPFAALIGWIDRRLERSSQRMGPKRRAEEERWQTFQPLLERVRAEARMRISPRRRRIQASAIVLLLLTTVGWVGWKYRPRTPTPEKVVQTYFDHLDFNRREKAYDLLYPPTRPTFAAYQADLSRDGGLVASFGKLDDITTHVSRTTSAGVTVSADLTFLTSLEEFHMTREMTLRRVGGVWRIDLPLAAVYEPADKFTDRPTVSFLEQTRQTNAIQRSDTTDVADVPELAFRSVRSLRLDGRWVAVGEVVNMDVDPVDVTVTAQIRDAGDQLLASWDAAQVLIHKLLPGESSPFRIEFQLIAGTGQYGTEADGGVQRDQSTTDGETSAAAADTGTASSTASTSTPVEFDPSQITPLVLSEGSVPARVDLYARGSVTSRGTTRGLQVSQLAVERAVEGTYFLTGEMRNDMTIEAAIPHLLLAYLTKEGEVGWVDHVYLPNSIAPQRQTTFRVAITDGAGMTASGLPTRGYAGTGKSPAPKREAMVATPAGNGFAMIQVYATTYVRGGK
ncbi:hypothetical protein [Actinoplanes sp. NBRC 101535]|uniref:hypothetical protein n=1 Tax=Actinoplanes sp. NBRC 101535 TaxID=3032196 RepID=UPI0024A2ABF4|nr:hypothetical protein [Actinoplanes sp. NBRC 101535]GLX99850.1 hypothetical protein Acsp01_02300 [Actinoplanes sp. NBRC 101535]